MSDKTVELKLGNAAKVPDSLSYIGEMSRDQLEQFARKICEDNDYLGGQLADARNANSDYVSQIRVLAPKNDQLVRQIEELNRDKCGGCPDLDRINELTLQVEGYERAMKNGELALRVADGQTASVQLEKAQAEDHLRLAHETIRELRMRIKELEADLLGDGE